MRRSLSAIAPLVFFAFVPTTAMAQTEQSDQGLGCRQSPAAIGDPLADYAHLLRLLASRPLAGDLILRTSTVTDATLCADTVGPWRLRLAPADTTRGLSISLLPAQLHAIRNSAYPAGANDGPLWAGRGMNAEVDLGARLRWGPVTAVLAPAVTYSQNIAFARVAPDVPGLSPYGYAWHPGAIDWPDRFGPDAFTKFWPGQSYVRFDARGFMAGASTENLWWGPARFNPIVMSNNAPGFPHVFIGTSSPRDIRIGRVDARMIWGRLTESQYFEINPAITHALFAGIVATFQPAPFPGVSLGFTRSYLRNWEPGASLGSLILDPYRHPFANVGDTLAGVNQIGSVFLRVAPTGSGFEGYAELAREDSWDGIRDLLMEPDHSQGYTLGFQQVFGGQRWWRLYGELTHLGASTTIRSGRGQSTFYIHSAVHQGYTERGQLLGSSIGPGSQSEIAGIDRFNHIGSTGIWFERIRHDDDAYFDLWARYYDYRGHDLELITGLRQTVLWKGAVITASVSRAGRDSRDFLGLDGQNYNFRYDRNWTIGLSAAWRP